MKTPGTSTILHLAGKMKRPIVPKISRAKRRRRSLTSSIVFGTMLALITTAAFYTASSASSGRRAAGGRASVGSSPAGSKAQTPGKRKNRAALMREHRDHNSGLVNPVGLFSLLMPQAAPVESISTFAADCTTPKNVFNLGETVCAQVTAAPLRVAGPLRRFNWSDPDGNVQQTLDVTTADQSNLFTIPTNGTSVIDGVTIDNRGTWAASLNSNSDGSTRSIAYFSVKDPANAAADLAIYNFSTDTSAPVAPGGNTSFFIWAANHGPDNAQNVHITQATPPNMSFASVSSVNGAAFTCTTSMSGVTDCAISSLASGDVATLTINYSVNNGSSNGVVSSSATISSVAVPASGSDPAVPATDDPHPDDNSSDASVEIRTGGTAASTCTLTCPADMIVTANATQGGQPGAIVNYSGASVLGDCGAVSNSPASGTFLPVGVNTVTSSAEAGSSCTFTVTVLDSAAPTITCPANITVTAVGSADEATVNPGTPTFTSSSGGTITGVRSDSKPPVTDDDGNVITPGTTIPLTDPYPVGVTGILWTVTGSAGRTASCTQKITVNPGACAGDNENPTITAPDDVTVYTGAGNTGCKVALDDELGQADANDNCSASVTISGIPAGNAFAPGTYTLTYTATDGSGNTATDTQVVTVIDNTPPVIKAPDNATYGCLSDVPAASASQATRGEVLDENGNPLPPGPPFENCGTPVVTVSESASGVGTASSPRIITRTFTATDAANNSASDTQIITVIDSVPPSIALNGAASMTVECHTSFTDPGVTASDNCAGLAPVTVTGSVDVNTPGTYTLTYRATDAVGNQSPTLTRTVTVVDTTPPTVVAPANITVYLPLNSTATSRAVTYPNPATATDTCGGTTITYSPASGSIFNVGTTTVTVTATDDHGNSASVTFTVTVLYNFTGFFSPVGNLPILNAVNAGRAIPVKFSLSGNKGLNIFAPNNPYTIAINCSTTDPAADITETVNAGGSTLGYSPDQYNYVWKTESSWAGTCRQLVVTLNDGSVHRANFKFK